jgi:4-amino-4-deoxy-L-arabinose transferase-like glycosyltransferase
MNKLKSLLPPFTSSYLLVFGLFLFATGHVLFSKYMFMDGLFYTTIARNISIGDCSLWHLKFTNTFFPEFHEHPPLAMFIESLYFDLFGYNWFVDKFYSFSTYIFTAVVIHKIWKLVNPNYAISWLIIFFWLFTPVVFWAVGNNMLENTMTIFILLSVYFLLRNIINQRWYFIILAGIFIVLGFLTKGFVALFPISFFFIHFLVFRNFSIVSMIRRSLLLIAACVIPLLLLFLLQSQALEAMKDYVSVQVINSLNNVVTVESRFFIVKRLLSELLVVFILLAILYFFTRKKGERLNSDKLQKKWALFFIFFGLTGVLPIMVSMKQSGYYILPSYPLLIIGIASLFIQKLYVLHLKLHDFKYFKIIGIVLFSLGLIYSLTSINKYGKDEKLVKDVEVISSYLKKGTIVTASETMIDDFSLHAYLYRFNFISIDCNNKFTSRFYLVNTEEPNTTELGTKYMLVPLNTKVLKLYCKK